MNKTAEAFRDNPPPRQDAMGRYDTKCFDLAEQFLQDVPALWTTKRVDELALAIQLCIEDYISDEKEAADKLAKSIAAHLGRDVA